MTYYMPMGERDGSYHKMLQKVVNYHVNCRYFFGVPFPPSPFICANDMLFDNSPVTSDPARDMDHSMLSCPTNLWYMQLSLGHPKGQQFAIFEHFLVVLQFP